MAGKSGQSCGWRGLCGDVQHSRRPGGGARAVSLAGVVMGGSWARMQRWFVLSRWPDGNRRLRRWPGGGGMRRGDCGLAIGGGLAGRVVVGWWWGDGSVVIGGGLAGRGERVCRWLCGVGWCGCSDGLFDGWVHKWMDFGEGEGRSKGKWMDFQHGAAAEG